MKPVIVPGILSLAILAVPALAAGRDKPTGQEIAEKARRATLDTENSTVGDKGGRKVKFSPFKHDVKNEGDAASAVENGVLIGVLESEAVGDETGLPPAKYNLFLTKVGNTWQVYAESGGKIVAEGAHVRVERKEGAKPANQKAEFSPNGWCWRTCALEPGWYLLTGVCWVWLSFCF